MSDGPQLASIRIPPVLRRHCDGQTRIDVPGGSSVASTMAGLVDRYPALRSHLIDDAGELHRFINVFVGETNIRDLADSDTIVDPGVAVTLLPAVAGG